MTSPVAHQHGFTLMEVLIAVTITSVIGMGIWQVINSVVASRDRVNDLANQFDGLQKTVLLLERDITQIVNRPARDIYGDFQGALTTREDGYEFMLTRQGWRNPLGLRRSSLQRVAWEYTGNELRRHYWPVVDQGQEESRREVLLLDNVQAFGVRLLDKDGNRQEQWPPEDVLTELAAAERPTAALPRGIEVSLEHEQFGEIVRIFTLPDFDQAAAQELMNRKQQSEAGTDAE